MVTYFKVEGFDGDYFACHKYGTMSVGACARNFKEAPDAYKKSGRLEDCVGCQVGSSHATGSRMAVSDVVPHVSVKTAESIAYRVFCVRCRRSSSDEDNGLIGRMRLVCDHTLCMSCYNRGREVLHDRNAKGARPKKWRNLFTALVAYGSAGVTRVEKLSHPVHDQLEAGLTVLRRENAPEFLTWSPCAAVLEAIA